VGEYSRRALIEVARWIESDGLLRTEEQMMREMMDALGFRRKGTRIETALRDAITASRT